jgi:predicted NBD/HSP70 family sugar kinase
VASGAKAGDPTSVDLVARSGRTVGESLATLVNVLNPSVVTIGGTITDAGDQFLAAVRETVYRRSLPLATRDLRLVGSTLDHQEGIIGGASMVSARLLGPSRLERWVTAGSPLDVPKALLYA